MRLFRASMYYALGMALQPNLALAASASSLGSSEAALESTSREDFDPFILVEGQRRGSVLGDFLAETELSADGIRTLQAKNIAELVDALGPQAGGRRTGRPAPAVLINGRRVTDRAEVDRLPSEAVERVEVLGPEVAIHFGYRPDRKVINIVLKENFRAITTTLGGYSATEGGWSKAELEANIVRISGANRFTLDGSHSESGSLTEEERGIGLPASSMLGLATPDDFDLIDRDPEFRTLLPRTRRDEFGATYSTPISGPTTGTISVRLIEERKKGRLGLASGMLEIPPENPFAPDPTSTFDLRRLFLGLSPLRRTTRNRTVFAGLTLNGEIGRATWSIAAKWDHVRSKSRTDGEPDMTSIQQEIDAGNPDLDPFGPLPSQLVSSELEQTARFRSDRVKIEAGVQGPIADIPAGSITTNLELAGVLNRIKTEFSTAAFRSDANLSRDSFSALAGINVPIASRKTNVLGGLGELSINVSAAVHDHSDFGSQTAFSYGLNWQPNSQTYLRVTFVDDRNVPTMQNLGNPIILTPGLRIYDFVEDEDAEILLLEGGNRNLREERRKSFAATISHRLLTGKRFLTLSLEYRDTSVRNSIGTLPAATAAYQAAFPDRFIRDANGMLTAVDARPVNFAKESTRRLRWGIQFSLPLGANTASQSQGSSGNPKNAKPKVIGSLFHDWQLRNKVTLRQGQPSLNLDGKDLFGYPGNWPRHSVQFELSFYSGGFGAKLSAQWKSGSDLHDQAISQGITSSELSFSSVLVADALINLDLGEMRRDTSGGSWLEDMTVSIGVRNVFNERLRVRDKQGMTPFSYQSPYFDPLGRAVSLGLRKQF